MLHEESVICHGLHNGLFGRIQLFQNAKDMLADVLPHLLFEIDTLGLTLGIDDISDGGFLVHMDSGRLRFSQLKK